MGRGRQKAKDAKIARQIKYGVHGADLRELERELIVGQGASAAPKPQSAPARMPDKAPNSLDPWDTGEEN